MGFGVFHGVYGFKCSQVVYGNWFWIGMGMGMGMGMAFFVFTDYERIYWLLMITFLALL